MATKKTIKVKKDIRFNVSPAMFREVNQLLLQFVFNGIDFEVKFKRKNPELISIPDIFYLVCFIRTSDNRSFYVYQDGKVLSF